jgi:hypothetical protein
LVHTFTLVIKTKKMFQSILQLARAVVATFALIAIYGCGPGTGGTSPGPILNTPATGNPTQNSAVTQITNDFAIGNWASVDAKVAIAADKVTVMIHCIQYNFEGAWQIDANQNLIRLAEGNTLTIVFSNLQLSFTIKNSVGETIAAGTGLNKVSPTTSPSMNQCP